MEECAKFLEVVAGFVKESASDLVEDVVVATISVSNDIIDFRPDKETEVLSGGVHLLRETGRIGAEGLARVRHS